MDHLICELTIKALVKLEYINFVRSSSRLICDLIETSDEKEDLINNIELVVSEACTNAVKYSSNDANNNKHIIVKFKLFEKKLIIEVTDYGKGFNFNNVSGPDFDAHPESGYGLFIIKTLMDEVNYISYDKYNTLSMTKYFTPLS